MNFLNKITIGIICLFFAGFMASGSLRAESLPTPSPLAVATEADSIQQEVLVAEVIDAEEVGEYSLLTGSNNQMLTLRIITGSKSGTELETALAFPVTQFKEPLKVGEKVLLEVSGDIGSDAKINLLSRYRQNNLLVWGFMFIGLFILIAGFRSNIKYFQIFIISSVAGLIVLFLYHRNTYLAFGALFLWLIIATIWFAINVFRKREPSIILVLSVFANLILAMLLVFIMRSINIFDTSFFDLFISTSYDAREVMMYLFAILVIYPLTVVFAEQIIAESIKKKKEESDILKIQMIQYISRTAIRNLNTIFLTFFGLFFAIFVGVIALASRDQIVFQTINGTPLAQILSVGFLILFNLLIFVPLVSFAVGMWLGRFEAHELITDQNVKQLEL